MALRVGAPDSVPESVGRRTDVVGLSIGKRQDEVVHLELGWAALQRVDIYAEDTELCLHGQKTSFYQARIGRDFPDEIAGCETRIEEGGP